MVRPEGWELRFSQYLEDTKKTPFEWGFNDCVMFAAKGLEVITGQDFYSQYLGYTTELGANEIVKENGGLENLISQHIGNPHKNYLNARRGDMVLLKAPLLCLGLVDDTGQNIVAVSPLGWIKVPLSKAYKIWSY